jgi:4-alpha-glucanotransferase
MSDGWGIDDGYHDIQGQWHPTEDRTREAIRASIGAPLKDNRAVVVVRQGTAIPIPNARQVRDEFGSLREVDNSVPADLSPGYYDVLDEQRNVLRRLIVGADRCAPPPPNPIWGFSLQLYSLRSHESWGIGDLCDLRDFGRWARGLGARVTFVNPLGAALPTASQEPSPYYASSRRYLSPLYLRPNALQGVDSKLSGLGSLREAAVDLNHATRIDRDRVFELKMQALWVAWLGFKTDQRFDAYIAAEGDALRDFAVFNVLVEAFGTGWPSFPDAYRSPRSEQVAAFRASHRDRVIFHQWIQWQLHEQIESARKECGLVLDLPVGIDPSGADAWVLQDALALDQRVGAPPDEFNRGGQDWGLPPFVPARLQEKDYEPFSLMLRASFRYGCGLRVDHVMQLFRLFWIPRAMEAGQGAYVRYPAEDLLTILALESQRAQCFVVGEDLGTVEAGVRENLANRGVLSYRVLLFEEQPPEHYPSQALAAVTTHDLPTISGIWSGKDLERQRALGMVVNEGGTREMQRRLSQLSMHGADPQRVQDVTLDVYRRLAGGSARLAAVSLEDLLGVEERPNMPGTSEKSVGNWARFLPLSFEEIVSHPMVVKVACVMREARPLADPG